MNKFINKNENENEVYILYSWNLFSSYDEHMNYLISFDYIREIYYSPIGDEQESFVIYEFTDKYYDSLLSI